MTSTAEISRENGAKSKGRPRPQKNRLALHKIGKLLHEDESPVDIMMDNMLFWHRKVQESATLLDAMLARSLDEIETKSVIELLQIVFNNRERSQACAVDLAPYVHPRLQAIAVQNAGDNKVVIEGGLPRLEAPKQEPLSTVEQAVGEAVLSSSNE